MPITKMYFHTSACINAYNQLKENNIIYITHDDLNFNPRKFSPKEQEELDKKIVRQMLKCGDTKEISRMCECSLRHVQSMWMEYCLKSCKIIHRLITQPKHFNNLLLKSSWWSHHLHPLSFHLSFPSRSKHLATSITLK